MIGNTEQVGAIVEDLDDRYVPYRNANLKEPAMSLKIAALLIGFVLITSGARAEPFNTSGYVLPEAVEILATRDMSKLQGSSAASKELFMAYALSFGVALRNEWPDKIDEKLSKIMYQHYMMILFFTKSQTRVEQANSAATADAKLFARRYDRNSYGGLSAQIVISGLVIGLNKSE